MKTAYKKGLFSETLACLLLCLKGYTLLERRWRSPLGEVDIIAKKARTLIFVEVKARQTLFAASESIMPRQKARIHAAATQYLARHPAYSDFTVRFDAVLFSPFPHHLHNAWQEDLNRAHTP